MLLATSSFWQGVDVVGEALSLASLCEHCVTLDESRGALPDDARSQAYEAVYQGYREQVRQLQ